MDPATSSRLTVPPGLARLAAAALALTLVEGAACLPPGQADAGPKQSPLAAPKRVGRIAHAGIRESSGIVASRRRPGLFWTLNDSGNPPTIYAIDAKGNSTGQYRLQGSRNVDWEDIAMDEAGRLYIADVGDNARRRRSLTIYAVSEPDPKKTGRLAAEATVRLRYPRGHGPFDCEAVMVRKGWTYLITKEFTGARLYRARLAEAAEVVEAEYLGALPEAAWITAADLSPDGRHMAALTYSGMYVYDLPAPLERLVQQATTATSPTTRPVQVIRQRPRRRQAGLGQCEAIGWAPAERGWDLVITSEERDIYRVRAAVSAAPASGPSR